MSDNAESFQVPEAKVLRLMLAQSQQEKLQAQAAAVQAHREKLEAELKSIITEDGKYVWDGQLDADTMTAKRTLAS